MIERPYPLLDFPGDLTNRRSGLDDSIDFDIQPETSGFNPLDSFKQSVLVRPAGKQGRSFGDGAFDAACLCVSVQYLQRPVDVFREVGRVLRAGAPFVVSFSNRCFPTKAVAIWQSISGPDQQRLVAAYMRAAGFTNVVDHASTSREGDPLWIVIGIA